MSNAVREHEERIASQILSLMEKDGINWLKPWATMKPFFNASSGHTYTGGNVFTLMLESMVRELDDPRFMTFKQARMLGGSVRKGSKGIPIIYFGSATRTDDAGEEKGYRFARLSHLFPLADIDGLDLDALPPPGGDLDQNEDERIQSCDAFFAAQNATVTERGDRAFYAPKSDTVTMPPFKTFVSAESFYATLAHEMVHWTGHASRLDRGLLDESCDYAFEELVAEIGSVFVANRLGIMPEPRDENAAYIKGWMKKIKDKPSSFWSAASRAQAAADFLRNRALISGIADIEEAAA